VNATRRICVVVFGLVVYCGIQLRGVLLLVSHR
jgi:hypothetical protein